MSSPRYALCKLLKDDILEIVFLKYQSANFLPRYWNTKELVEELFQFGDIIILGKEIGSPHDFEKGERPNSCSFYKRDLFQNKNESYDSIKMSNLHFVLGWLYAIDIESVYVFLDNHWIQYNLLSKYPLDFEILGEEHE